MPLSPDLVQQDTFTTVDNDTRRVEFVQLGPVEGIDNGTRGTLYFDAFESRRNTYIGPVAGLLSGYRMGDLRGPVEGVLFRKGAKCGHTFPRMTSSGFYDAGGLVCPGCGNVYFKCVYDETPAPLCACGSTYPESGEVGCPKCSAMDLVFAGTQSGYEYFKSHTFIRGPGA